MTADNRDLIAWHQAGIIKHEHGIALNRALYEHYKDFYGGNYPAWSTGIGPVAQKQQELLDGIEKHKKAIEECREMIKILEAQP